MTLEAKDFKTIRDFISLAKPKSWLDNQGARRYKLKTGFTAVEKTLWSNLTLEEIEQLINQGQRIYVPDPVGYD